MHGNKKLSLGGKVERQRQRVQRDRKRKRGQEVHQVGEEVLESFQSFWIYLKSIKPLRRRYTDSRHPTTELPDVRGGLEPLPSVRWVDATHFGGSIKMKILMLMQGSFIYGAGESGLHSSFQGSSIGQKE